MNEAPQPKGKGKPMIAIIPAKHTSIRLAEKNIKDFSGKPLIKHCIDRLKAAGCFECIYVGTDSDIIADIAIKENVEVIKREQYYCDETRADANMMIMNMIENMPAREKLGEAIAWIHCTNPLVQPETYAAAAQTFCRMCENRCLVSVSCHRGHYWNSDGNPITYNPYKQRHTLAGNCDPIYKQDGAIFIRTSHEWKRNPRFIGNNPYLFVVPDNEIADIDTMDDFVAAEAKWKASNE